METALELVVEDIVNLFACMVVLIEGCWVEMLVLTSWGPRGALLVFEAIGRRAA